jgi:hypothetical protein
MSSIAPPTFLLQTDESKPITFDALLGAEPPKVAGGGGWQVTARPRRQGITDWVGREPVRLTVPFLLDGWAEGKGVPIEKQIRNLEVMSGIGLGSLEPPLVRVFSGGVIPYDSKTHDGLRWVVESVDWGASLRNPYGNRVRQDGTIVLLRYVADARLERLKPVEKDRERRRRGGRARRGRGGRRVYVVKKGDTLSKIAARELGKASRWREIAKLNNLRDPNKLKVGQRLKLP